MVSLGRRIRFSLVEKLEGTKNSFFEIDKKDAHQEKVLLLKIATFEDLIMLKSFLMESDFKIDICKSLKYSKFFYDFFSISLIFRNYYKSL